jgi:hypothetical protein
LQRLVRIIFQSRSHFFNLALHGFAHPEEEPVRRLLIINPPPARGQELPNAAAIS